MKIVGLSKKGLVKTNNEDCYVIDSKSFYNDSIVLDKATSIFVCDGVSNSNSGENASKLVCDELANNYSNFINFAKNECLDFIEDVNRKLLIKFEGSYTTIAGLVINEDVLKVINVGDSKVYRYREGMLKQLTIDDTYYEYLKSINDESYKDYEGSHAITACLGMNNFDKKNVHYNEIEFGIMPKDKIFVCSDGVSDMISKDELINILEQNIDINDIIVLMENKIVSNGAKDNYTIVLMEV